MNLDNLHVVSQTIIFSNIYTLKHDILVYKLLQFPEVIIFLFAYPISRLNQNVFLTNISPHRSAKYITKTFTELEWSKFTCYKNFKMNEKRNSFQL